MLNGWRKRFRAPIEIRVIRFGIVRFDGESTKESFLSIRDSGTEIGQLRNSVALDNRNGSSVFL